jgi:hypothetical protein
MIRDGDRHCDCILGQKGMASVPERLLADATLTVYPCRAHELVFDHKCLILFQKAIEYAVEIWRKPDFNVFDARTRMAAESMIRDESMRMCRMHHVGIIPHVAMHPKDYKVICVAGVCIPPYERAFRNQFMPARLAKTREMATQTDDMIIKPKTSVDCGTDAMPYVDPMIDVYQKRLASKEAEHLNAERILTVVQAELAATKQSLHDWRKRMQ